MAKPSKRQCSGYGRQNERRTASSGEEDVLTVGTEAPDFVLENFAGQSQHLAEALTDGPVILAFFKADCATCQIAFPYLALMLVKDSLARLPSDVRWLRGST